MIPLREMDEHSGEIAKITPLCYIMADNFIEVCGAGVWDTIPYKG